MVIQDGSLIKLVTGDTQNIPMVLQELRNIRRDLTYGIIMQMEQKFALSVAIVKIEKMGNILQLNEWQLADILVLGVQKDVWQY